MLTSTGARSDIGDGLTLFQSHSYRLPREEVIVSQLKRTRVVIYAGGYEGDSRWCLVLHHLHAPRGGEGRGDVYDTSRA